MDITVSDDVLSILHPRVSETCVPLIAGEHYGMAALEAMKQVELTLKQKGLQPDQVCGKRLIDATLGDKGHIAIEVPLAEYLQEEAKALFSAAFGYYRNYAAHDGQNFDRKTSLRVLVLASELLDLLAASKRCLDQVGGVKAIVRLGYFSDEGEFQRLLSFLHGQSFLNEAWDGLWEDLVDAGFAIEQMDLMFDLGLVSARQESAPTCAVDTVTTIELMLEAKKILGTTVGAGT